jgi:ferredoxin
MESITIYIQRPDFSLESKEIPLGIDLTLMEVLKGDGENIEATCGGMALCATCRVQVLNNDPIDGINCPAPNDAELDMLETLPCYTGNCRLSCQMHISEDLHGMIIKFPEEVLV